MLLLLIIGIALTGAAVWLLALAVAMPRLQTAERLSRIGAYGYPAAAGAEDGEPALGTLSARLDRLADRIGAAAMPRFGGDEGELRNLLVSAGMYGIAPNKFLGYRLLGAIALPLAWLWYGPALGMGGAAVVVGAPLTALIGWLAPLTVVRRRAERRLAEIDYELPELIDALVVTVEAGSGFNAALQMASRELGGPLGDEIALALREQAMGLSNEAALGNMVKRADTPAMHAFVRAVLQGERLGVSIGDIMRSLAVDTRSRRRTAAEERAHKAPVKLLFPLVLLIFPSIMIILLYPALHNITEALSGH
jgi:tight adherence protein C